MASDQVIPRSALSLGVAGVAPFVLFAAAERFKLGPPPAAAIRYLVGYGAIILSFMGGAQWGLTTGGPNDRGFRGYGVSVLPALIGWACLFAPPRWALFGLAAAFGLLLAYDRWTVRGGMAPIWYGRLRLYLTLAVTTCLAAGALSAPGL